MADSNKDLLNLEKTNSSSSTIESKLIVCQNNEFRQTQNPKPKPHDGMPIISSVPKSQVLGKAKDFLGVFLEANKRLEDDAKDNAKEYDIEALTGSESEYIEMPNVQKTAVFFGGVNDPFEAPNAWHPFPEACFPIKYLGVLLISTKLKAGDCAILKDKILHQI